MIYFGQILSSVVISRKVSDFKDKIQPPTTPPQPPKKTLYKISEEEEIFLVLHAMFYLCYTIVYISHRFKIQGDGMRVTVRQMDIWTNVVVIGGRYVNHYRITVN